MEPRILKLGSNCFQILAHTMMNQQVTIRTLKAVKILNSHLNALKIVRVMQVQFFTSIQAETA